MNKKQKLEMETLTIMKIWRCEPAYNGFWTTFVAFYNKTNFTINCKAIFQFRPMSNMKFEHNAQLFKMVVYKDKPQREFEVKSHNF